MEEHAERTYEESSLYRQGIRAEELAAILKNPRATVRDLADWGVRWGMNLTLMLYPVPMEKKVTGRRGKKGQ